MGKHRFENMAGRTYLYNGEQYAVGEVVALGGGMYSVITDKRALKVTAIRLRKDFLPVTVPKNGASMALAKRVQADLSPIRSMLDVLEENIKKVRQDAKYIPQAKAINDQVKSAISLAKLQLDIVKLAKGK